MKTYRTRLKLLYEETDITKDITNSLLDFSYTDSDAESEDLQIKLENSKRLWFKEWFPNRGDKLKPEIEIYDEYEKVKKLPLGIFEVDDIQATGLPNTVTIKAISSLVTGEFKDTKRNQAWEKVKFKSIVEEISKRHGYKTIFHIIDEKEYDKLDQNNMSDIEFLFKICDELNYGLKVENKIIIITEEAYYEKNEPLFTIYYENLTDEKKGFTRNKDFSLLNYDLKQSALTSYTAAELSYKDPKTGKTYYAKVGNEKEQITGKILRLNKKVKSDKEAEEICKKELEKNNKKTNPAKFTIAPRFPISSKSVIAINGFGQFDGKYLINSVSHNISKSGYTVDLDCSKFIAGIGMLKRKSEEETKELDDNTSSTNANNSKGIEAMISYAESNLGKRYSQEERMSKNAFDCSSLASRSMTAGGFAPPGASWSTRTIANSGYLVEVPMSELRRGDVLNSYDNHAMIYLGDNKVIEAQPKRGVSYGNLRTKGYKAYRPKGA